MDASTNARYDLTAFEPGRVSEATKVLNDSLLKLAKNDQKWWDVGHKSSFD